MMSTLRGLTLTSACVLLFALSLAVYHLDQVLRHLDVTVRDTQDLVRHTDVALNGTGLARPQDHAVLPGLTQAVRDVRQTVVDANRAQKTYYADLQPRTDALLTHLDVVLASSDATIQGLNASQRQLAADAAASFERLDAALSGITPVTTAATATLTRVGDTLADPNIAKTLANVELTSEHVGEATASAALAADDIQGKVHSATHPSKLSLFLGGLWNVAKIAATHVP